MTLEYHRPNSLEQALDLLERGVPLGGGTVLTPNRRSVQAVIDLSALGLDRIERSERTIQIGAAAQLQSLVEADLPAELVRVCKLEAGWNLRNQATLGGTIVASDGRSPLAAVLLAFGAELTLEPDAETLELDRYLEARPEGRLITTIRMPVPDRSRYEQVARSPADRPQVCVAAAVSGEALRVALGGYGQRPRLLGPAEPIERESAEAMAEAAQTACADWDDAWASGEYRAAAAGALARRVVGQVIQA